MRVDRKSLGRYLELRLHAPSHVTSQVQGNRRSPQRGKGLEFADYRAYDPGDDIRLIDWNVYMRLGVALVKQFAEERSLSLKLCVDASDSMSFGAPAKGDHAAQLVAAIAMMALAQREPVTLLAAGGSKPAMRARAVNLDGLPELIHLLEKAECVGRSDLRAQLSAQLGASRSDRLVLASDLLVEDDEREGILRLCAASSHHPVLLHVLGPEELTPELDDVGRVVDSETNEEIVLRDGARAEYDAALKKWLSAIEDRCRRLGITYLLVPTNVTVDQVVRRDLHRTRIVEHRTGGVP